MSKPTFDEWYRIRNNGASPSIAGQEFVLRNLIRYVEEMLRPTYVDPCLDLSDAIRKFKYTSPLTWKTEREERMFTKWRSYDSKTDEPQPLYTAVRTCPETGCINPGHRVKYCYEPIGDEV